MILVTRLEFWVPALSDKTIISHALLEPSHKMKAASEVMLEPQEPLHRTEAATSGNDRSMPSPSICFFFRQLQPAQ